METITILTLLRVVMVVSMATGLFLAAVAIVMKLDFNRTCKKFDEILAEAEKADAGIFDNKDPFEDDKRPKAEATPLLTYEYEN